MEKINVLINYKDPEYCRALVKAVYEYTNSINCISSASDMSDCIILDESSLPLYLPVSEIVNRVYTMANRQQKPAKAFENIIFTAFCSGIGGSGLSTTAASYASIQSRVFSKSIAFISFDPEFRNDFSKYLSYDLDIISYIDENLSCEELVLDIPWGCENYEDYLNMSDRRIVVSGFNESRQSISKEYFDWLNELSSAYSDKPENYYFVNHFDNYINDFDIHGQLGKDLMSFIRDNL